MNFPWWQRLSPPALARAVDVLDRALRGQVPAAVGAQAVEDALTSARAPELAAVLAGIGDAPSAAAARAELARIAEELFEHPSQRLVAYGTLGPGQSHEHLVFPAEGTWEPAQVEGHIDRTQPYARFYWRPGTAPQAVHLLRGPRLDRCWAAIDAWEGEEYVRTFVPVLSRRGWEVATIYLAADNLDEPPINTD